MQPVRLVVAGIATAFVLGIAGCAAPPAEFNSASAPPTVQAPAPATTDSTTGPAPTVAGNRLAGTAWQLVKFQGGDDATLVADDKSKYALAFAADGRVSVRIDCNRGSGTWRTQAGSQLQFGPLALTRAMCPQAALTDRLTRDWPAVRSYVLSNGHLFLSLMADGGVYEFEPAP